jgi:hypothetical protein
MTPRQIKGFAFVMANLDRDTLEQEGVLTPGQVGGSDWKRFNDDPLTFILKLPADRLEKLARVIADEMVE